MVSRKEKERIFREDLIIDAATKLFKKNGFDSATMEDIAKEADYTKPTLYKYFKNREEILLAVYLQGWQDSLDMLYAAMEEVETGIEKLEWAADAYFKFFSENVIYFDLLRYMYSNNIKLDAPESDRKKNYENRRKQIREDFGKVIKLGMDDGTICDEFDVKIAVEYYFSNLYITMHKKYSSPDIDTDFVEKSKKMILRTFRK